MVEASSYNDSGGAFTSAPPLDNAVLRQRLLQGVGAGTAARGSLSKCALKYRDFVARYQDAAGDADAVESTKQDLVRELNLYQVEMTKVGLSVQAANADAAQIDKEREAVAAQIAAAQKDIDALRKAHPEAKQVRRNLEEYEALAKMANTRPSRLTLERKKAKIDAELKEVEESVQTNREEKALREKQFHLFMQSLFDLKESLAEDVEKKEEAEQGEDDDDDSDDDDDEGEVKPMDTS
jgi:chromosome segregation ATPase